MEQEFQVVGTGTTAVDRSADLLVRVLESEEPVALTELADAAGLPKSTASRLVSALERRGLIAQTGARGKLRPGPAILRVAERSMLERSIVELAKPTLDSLSEATGETINLAVPGATGVEHIAQVDSTHFLGAGQWLGRSVDYEHSANGKVFLAFGRAPGRSAQTVSEDELKRIRASGYATAIDELELGLAAVAVPVWGARGDVIAALSISGPTLRMTPERVRELRPELTKEGRTLSRRLGYPDEGANAA
ncbi:MAG TPA: IclR family transcriptional regulator [Solirubrobacteraceae bacterium]|nr:IclR family transcriptional regulator [Solirubrobacteraceae bacterium]